MGVRLVPMGGDLSVFDIQASVDIHGRNGELAFCHLFKLFICILLYLQNDTIG